jgi:methionine-gamma-lyase
MKKDLKISRRKFLGSGTLAATVGLTGVGLDTKEASADIISIEESGSLQAPTYKSIAGRDVTSDAVHAGDLPDYSSVPIYQGTTNHGQYTADSNPTIDSVEDKINQLEGAEFGVATACGMAAISHSLLAILKPGSRVVTPRNIYGRTQRLLDESFKSIGVETEQIDMTDLKQLKKALAKKTTLVYFEVHSNPAMDVVDVKAASAMARAAGAMTIVDNTFLSPYLIQPLALGADIVVHSATKYMMGHGNGLAGIACGSRSLLEEVGTMRILFGGILSPANAALLHQGLKTLPMRMERQCRSAMTVATFLESHSKVKKVRYPGLASDPGHEVASSQLNGFGGMLGFEMYEAPKLTSFVKLCRPIWSLGDVQTLIGHYPTTHNPARGIPANYTRVSVGIEDPDDIIADLKQALDQS